MRGFNIFAKQPDAATVEIWPENVQSVNLFLCVGTQWRVGGMGDPTGRDYPAVFATMDRMLRSETQERKDALFADLQVMERAALDERAKK